MLGIFKPTNTSKKMSIPKGQRIYAIGDIHGCYDLLQQLIEKINQDVQSNPVSHTTEIYLGDYIDRGHHSADVINWLTASTATCDNRICIKGNHELYPISFLSDSRVYEHWKRLGGRETLLSYDLDVPLTLSEADLNALQRDFAEKIPKHHIQFFNSLETSITIGDYVFVHAGLRPGVALDKQDAEDLLWIRDEFLKSEYHFGKIVVHGHTPVELPEVMPNRINVDTGAYATGRLSCLVLEQSDIRFIHT